MGRFLGRHDGFPNKINTWFKNRIWLLTIYTAEKLARERFANGKQTSRIFYSGISVRNFRLPFKSFPIFRELSSDLSSQYYLTHHCLPPQLQTEDNAHMSNTNMVAVMSCRNVFLPSHFFPIFEYHIQRLW